MRLLEKVLFKKNTDFYDKEQVEVIHLELTDRCNASCPQCARNINGGAENQYLPNRDLSLTEVKNILPEYTVRTLKRLYMCGNYGDPIVARDTLEVFKYLRQANPNIKLSMNTNASARSVEWWRELGRVIGQKGDVKFSVDGLSETNHLYRRGTNFSKIKENATAFIEAGGNAIWEFIVFGHNEHQVEQARQLANSMGFSDFRVKKTGRFFSNTKREVKQEFPVKNKNGEVEYYLEMPKNKEYLNKSLKKEKKIIEQHGSMTKYLDKTHIDCKVKSEKSLYISSEGLAFPCCWIANQMYIWYQRPKANATWKLLLKSGDKKTIDLNQRTLAKITKSSFFNSIEKSWTKESLECGKLAVCAKTCGKDFDQFKDQYES